MAVAAFATPRRASTYSPYDPQICFAADNNLNGRIDMIDYQRAARHYGAVLGRPGANGYDPQFDIQPFPMGDDDIDNMDFQIILGRYGGICSVVKKAAAYFDLGSPGRFYNDVIATGYESAYYGPDGFGMRVLGANVARSQGVENCVQLDLTWTLSVVWDESAPYGPLAPQVSPNTLMASGPYMTGASVCLAYHVIYGFSWAYWENEAYPLLMPELHPDSIDGYGQCYTLWPAGEDFFPDPRNTPYCWSQPSGSF